MKQGFYRSNDVKIIAGVCSGLSDKWNLNRHGFRALWLFFGITSLFPIFIYILCWIFFSTKSTKNFNEQPNNIIKSSKKISYYLLASLISVFAITLLGGYYAFDNNRFDLFISKINLRNNFDLKSKSSNDSNSDNYSLLNVNPVEVIQTEETQKSHNNDKQEFQIVIINGVGTDIQEASKNAAHNALVEVVGSFIDANTFMEKKTTIDNGIRSQTKNIWSDIKDYSQGSIKSFEILDSEIKKGLVTVKAKITVRNENFSAYIKKLAEVEVKVGSDLYAKISTKIENDENLKQILIDNIIIPISSGTVQEFTLSDPSILESEKLPEWLEKQFVQEHYDDPRYIIFKVETNLKKSFLDNLNRTLLEISHDHSHIDFNSNERQKILRKSVLFKKSQSSEDNDIFESFEFTIAPEKFYQTAMQAFKLKTLQISINDKNNVPQQIISANDNSMMKVFNIKNRMQAWDLLTIEQIPSIIIREHDEFYILIHPSEDVIRKADKFVVSLK
jgi:phage shock protein PspC (stress-responsive transcriptional regulator)